MQITTVHKTCLSLQAQWFLMSVFSHLLPLVSIPQQCGVACLNAYSEGQPSSGMENAHNRFAARLRSKTILGVSGKLTYFSTHQIKFFDISCELQMQWCSSGSTSDIFRSDNFAIKNLLVTTEGTTRLKASTWRGRQHCTFCSEFAPSTFMVTVAASGQMLCMH